MKYLILTASILAASLLLASCSDETKILGKYADPNGSTVEFLKDGTAVITIGAQQAVWKWSLSNGNRLKLEPTPGIWGAEAAVCNYTLSKTLLRVTGCEYAMRLTRM